MGRPQPKRHAGQTKREKVRAKVHEIREKIEAVADALHQGGRTSDELIAELLETASMASRVESLLAPENRTRTAF